jgi:hypothetical protein
MMFKKRHDVKSIVSLVIVSNGIVTWHYFRVQCVLRRQGNSCMRNPLLSRQEGIEVMSSFHLIDIRLAATHYEPPAECAASRRLYTQRAHESSPLGLPLTLRDTVIISVLLI